MIAALIARNTFREVSRDRLLTAVLVGGGLALVATQALAPLAMGEGSKLTVDLGLSTISLLGLFVILVVGTNLVSKELERRTIYTLLARPIGRPVYLVGKWLGLTGVLWLLAGVIGGALWLLLAIRGAAALGPAIVEATYMAGLELTVLTALAVLFSALSTPVLSALYTLSCFLVGEWSYDLRGFAQHAPPALRQLLELAANLVPNLPLFDIRTLATRGALDRPDHLAVATLYAATYAACALALAAASFESRDFK
jgi:ABC-type transport system involved in multi-copper enzyme maturation permease subunit